MQSRKTLLFQNSVPWVKKLGNENFDVSAGCYDGVEVCEIVGSFILNKLTYTANKSDIGIYHDDGLGIFYNVSKPEIERKKKAIVKIFKGCGLSITIQCNLKTVDFLDVTFDLDNTVYKPFRKENNKPIYINILTIQQAFSNNCQNQLKNEYPKHHPIRIFLMNQ